MLGVGFEKLHEAACRQCGGVARQTLKLQRFQYGEGDGAVELSATVPVWSCADCDDQYTDGDAEDIRHEVVCRHLGRLTPREIQDFRERQDLTQARLGQISGFGIASIKRWETGNQIQSLSADRYLRLIFSSEVTLGIAIAIEGSSSTHIEEPTFVTELPSNVRLTASRFRLRLVA